MIEDFLKAAETGNLTEIRRQLEDPNLSDAYDSVGRNYYKSQALAKAVDNDQLLIIQYLLDDKCPGEKLDIRTQGNALISSTKNAEIFNFIFEQCPNITAEYKALALNMCAGGGYIDIARQLLDSTEISLESKSKSLGVAIRNSQTDMTRLLLKDYNMMISTEEKYQALYFSSTRGQHEIFDILLEDPTIRELAASENNALIIELQRKATSNPMRFQPMVDKLMQVESVIAVANTNKLRVGALYGEINPDKIKFGPLNKSIYTQELEWIAKYALAHPDECTFFIENSIFYIRIRDNNVNLSHLLKHANLSHISLTEEDSRRFDPPIIQVPLRPEYTLENSSLTDAERFSIWCYTAEDYRSINYVLHANSTEHDGRQYYTDETFFKTLFLASALNKITPLWTRDSENKNPSITTYRGESYITPEELTQRVTRLKPGSDTGTDTHPGFVEKKPGFISTSTNSDIAKRAEFQKAKTLLKFPDGPYGRDISPFFGKPDEDEFLMLPSYIHITHHAIDNETNIFEANYITPLTDEPHSLKQEHEFNNLKRFENPELPLLSEALKTQIPRNDQLDNLIEACQFSYDEYLSKTYSDESNRSDWKLETPFGIIQRPNHGLAHTMRIAHMVPTVALFLMENVKDNRFNFNARDIYIIQLAAIFSIVGRKNENGFLDDKEGYEQYKKDSAAAFRKYVESNNFLNMTKEECDFYTALTQKMGDPAEQSPESKVLVFAHKLDLLRCYDSNRVNDAVIKSLSEYLSTEQIDILLKYDEDLLHATGDRVITGENKTSYDTALFYSVSTNAKACFNALQQVSPPLLATASYSASSSRSSPESNTSHVSKPRKPRKRN